jgi:hypothetical protein
MFWDNILVPSLRILLWLWPTYPCWIISQKRIDFNSCCFLQILNEQFSRILYWSYFGHGGEEEDSMLLSGIKLPPANPQSVTFLAAIMAQNCAHYYTFMRISIICTSSSSLQYQISPTKNWFHFKKFNMFFLISKKYRRVSNKT